MMHTEEDAKELWCPFARVMTESDSGDPVSSANRLPGIGAGEDPDLSWPSPRCIASRCMAWRWAEKFDHPPGAYEPGTVSEMGYCGLAGKP